MNKTVYLVMKDTYQGSFPWALYDTKEKAIEECRRLFPDHDLSDFTLDLMITPMLLE